MIGGSRNMALLEVTNVKKIYSTRFGGNQVQALANVTFSVESGEFVAIMGIRIRKNDSSEYSGIFGPAYRRGGTS